MNKINLNLRLHFLKQLEQSQQKLMQEYPEILDDNAFLKEREAVCFEISDIIQELNGSTNET